MSIIWWCPRVEFSLVFWPLQSLGRILLAFALLHSVLQGQICLLLQVFLDFLFLHSSSVQSLSRVQLFTPTTNAEEAEVEWFYDDLQDLLELTPKKCPFHQRGLEYKTRKTRNTWNNRQVGLGVQNDAGQRLTEFCQENALLIANTLSQQHKRQLYTWTSPDGQYQNQIHYILCSRKWSSI